MGPGRYTLEVTSPGVERALRTPEHFAREIGKEISVRLRDPGVAERRLTGLLIAADTRDPFGRLLAVGIVALIGSQTLINTGMTVGLLPITGMTLPMMSYGGSSLLATCLALGLLVNIELRPTYATGSEPFRFAE